MKSMNMLRPMVVILSVFSSFSCSKDDPTPGINGHDFNVFFVHQYSADAMGRRIPILRILCFWTM